MTSVLISGASNLGRTWTSLADDLPDPCGVRWGTFQPAIVPHRRRRGVSQVLRGAADKAVMASGEQTERTRAGVFGLAATVATVIAVVTFEFVLLYAVYHRADSVHAQRVVAARLEGRVQAAPGTVMGPAAIAAARADAARIDDAPALQSTLDALAARPADVTALANVRRAVAATNADLGDRLDTLDLQAVLVYVAGLLLASFGWMSWFRHLVLRHKALERQVAEQDARADSEKRLVALIHNSTDVIAVLEADSTVAFVTPSSLSVLGWAPEQLLGRRWIDDVVHADDLPSFVQLLAGQRHDDLQVAIRAQHRDGRILRLEGTLTNLLNDRSVGGIVLTVRDVTERHELEEQLTHHAFHDSLTGLANRRLFSDRLAHAIVRDGGEDERRAVIVFFDLDDFKIINDSVGHGVGDRVLVEVADRLRSIVRPADTAARLGGDEFAVLMEDSDLVQAEAIGRQLQEALARPIVVDGVSHVVTASVGLAEAGGPDTTWDDVLRNADVAMYLAKERGKAGIAVYEPALHAASLVRMQLHADLQQGLRDREFVLHFQPAYDLHTGEIVGFEALVRWERPGHGLVPPVEFIEEAERCGLIIPLGSWVLREACTAAASMQTDAHRPSMAVNVSAQQLAREEFVDEVLAVLTDTGLPADRLCLEITETSLLRDLDKVVTRLSALREFGVTVAVDDFGTGYSSLSYLSKLPVDVLKVDRSFVERVTVDAQDASVTHAILAMSSAMRLTTVAEGIEQIEQATWLASANCAIGQGFLWSRAVPLALARTMLLAPPSTEHQSAGPALRPVDGPPGPRRLLLSHAQQEPLGIRDDASAVG